MEINPNLKAFLENDIKDLSDISKRHIFKTVIELEIYLQRYKLGRSSLPKQQQYEIWKKYMAIE